jgi:hypothetical protein
MKNTTKLTHNEIDELLETVDKELFKEINWKFVTEEEMDILLNTL